MALEHVTRARNLEETLDLLAAYHGTARVIAGGTDLITQMREEKVAPRILIDISGLAALQYINETQDEIEIGAATVFSTLARNPLLKAWAPGLQAAAGTVGSPQIRNRGTIGGNICNGSPAADTVPPLLALDATVIFQSRDGVRETPLHSLHQEKGRIDIHPEELLTGVRFKKVRSNQGLGFYKLGLRKALAIATISLSVFLETDTAGTCRVIRIGSGALGRFPLREYALEAFLSGKPLEEAVIQEAAAFFSLQLQERLVGRPPVELEYKPEAVKGVFKNALAQAMQGADQSEGGRT